MHRERRAVRFFSSEMTAQLLFVFLFFSLLLPILLLPEMESGCDGHTNRFVLLVHVIGHRKQNASPERKTKKSSMHMFVANLRVCSVCACVSECVLLFFLPACSRHLLIPDILGLSSSVGR